MRTVKPRGTEFGHELTRLRSEAKLTQARLATQAGVSKGMVSHLETGVRPPTERIIRKIAGPLGVDPQLLYRAARILTLQPVQDRPEPEVATETVKLTGEPADIRVAKLFWDFLQFSRIHRRIVEVSE